MTYRPPQFRVDDRQQLLALIARYPLATLVTWAGGEPALTHLPLVALNEGDSLFFHGHIARANDQWRGGDGSGVAIFRIAEHYISPVWYATKRRDPRVVPTFDYVAIEARGPVRFIHDEAWLRSLVSRLTDAQEAQMGTDWSIGDAPEEYLASQLRAIVGVEVRVDSLIGTFKLNQHHPAENLESVIAALDARATPDALELAAFVRSAATRHS
jgi:transcriptional regulator